MRVERVVVTGGRGFTDGIRIEADLRSLLPLGLRRLGNGGARGADHEARLAWDRLSPGVDGWALYNYPVEPARDGPWPAAGCRRNERMLAAERPDLVLAYPDPDSRGTWHCVAEAIRRKVPVPVAVWTEADPDAVTRGLTRYRVAEKRYHCFALGGGHVVLVPWRRGLGLADVTHLAMAILEILEGPPAR